MIFVKPTFSFLLLLLLSVVAFAQPNLVPKPTFMERRPGFFVFDKTTAIIAVADNSMEVQQIAERLARRLGRVSTRDTKLFAGSFKTNIGISMVTIRDIELGNEGYWLEVKSKQIVITAEHPKGFENAARALLQLMPKEVMANEPKPNLQLTVPNCLIKYSSLRPKK
jgi:hexosaminidase